MINLLTPLLKDRRLLILGFGKEGQSTWRYMRNYFPGVPVAIADRDEELLARTGEQIRNDSAGLFLGEHYLDSLQEFRLIIKSPGVGLPEHVKTAPGTIITSQTRLMLEAYHRRIIGITGTKGKSTTSSLVHHLLINAGIPSVLVGNIGRPPFDYLDAIDPETLNVYEMSSHQLEDTLLAPHISVLLNLFPEHLDRYPSLDAYYSAKMRILTGQKDGDVFIYNEDIPGITTLIHPYGTRRKFYSFSSGFHSLNGCYLDRDRIFLSQDGIESEYLEVTDQFPLKGIHNRMNMMAALLAAKIAGADDESIRQGLKTFQGLEHRLEYAGVFRNIHFYNDSIATIPEAAIAAVKALPDTNTVILGGYDRMLDYSGLVDFMVQSRVTNFIFMGKAGERMIESFRTADRPEKKLIWADNLSEACHIAFEVTEQGKICLLSPAAASYDQFRNFEERGKLFKKLVRGE